MTSTAPTRRPRLTRAAVVAAGATVLLLGASACGSGGTGTTNAGARTGEQGGPQRQQQGGPAGRLPGANGKVAAVADTIAQVQGQQGQVAVSWTAATTFTRQVAGTLADVKVGTCVFVAPAGQPSSDSTTAPTAVTAGTVRITAAVDGGCGPRRGGQDGPSDSGPQVNGQPPAGEGPPPGAQPQLRGMGGAVGEVTAVSSTGFTVSSVMPGSTGTRSVAVTVDGATAYTKTARGTAADVKVGVCVQADGTTDDTGAVTARTIAVSPPQDGQCGGLVRFGSGDGGTSQAS